MEKTSVDLVWVAGCSFLVFLMQAGFLCLEAGQSRSKNFINVALKNIIDAGIAVIVFWAVGYGLMFGLTTFGWLGGDNFFPSLNENGAWSSTFFVFQTMFCSTAVTILSGAVAERVRITTYALLSVAISGLIYPVIGHWAWNGVNFGETYGWLGALGFVDFAGSTVVHSTGGWIAVAALIWIGPRMGRFPDNAPPRKIPGANIPLAVLGVLLLWLGWFGFNGGSTFAFDESVPRIIANTLLGSAAGLLTAAFFSLMAKRRIEVDWAMNGALAGAVSVTANCHAISPHFAVIIGAVGGVICGTCADWLEKIRIDDAVGAIPVHLAAGIWGTLATGLFADLELLGTGLGRVEQIGAQLLGIFVTAAWAFSSAWIVLWGVSQVMPLRVTREQEQIGMNVSEHGASTETQDFYQIMEQQARTGDLSLRVPEEPFTEIGRIAARYNQVMANLEKSVKRTDAIVESSIAGILTVSREGYRVTSINPAGEHILRIPANEAIGKPITSILDVTDEDGEGSPLLFGALLRELAEGRQRRELTGRRPNGSEFPMEIAVVESTAGDEDFFTITIENIAERKEFAREAELARQEREHLLQDIEEPVLLVDERGQILAANRAAAQQLPDFELGEPAAALLFESEREQRARHGFAQIAAQRFHPAEGKLIKTQIRWRRGRGESLLMIRRLESGDIVNLMIILNPSLDSKHSEFDSLPF